MRVYLTNWLKSAEPRLRASTFTRYSGIVDRQIIPALGTVKVAKLQPVAVSRMLAELQQTGLSPRTCHHVRAVLRTALQDGMRDRVLAQNAATLGRGPKVENFHVEPMSPAHAGVMLDAVAGTDLEAPVACALWTGLRQGELLGLRWADVDLDARRLSVSVTLQRRGGAWHVQPTKTDKSRRTVALAAPLVT